MKTGLFVLRVIPLILILVLSTSGCYEDPEPRDYDTYDVWVDHSADFSQYRTFGFMDFPEDQLEKAPKYVINNNARIRNSVTNELKRLGLTEAEDPDLIVSSLAYTEDATAYYYDCVSGFYWWGFWGGYSSCAWVDVDQVNYDIGLILIPIGDTTSQTLVFMGLLQGIVDDSSDRQDRIDDGVERIFNSWPH